MKSTVSVSWNDGKVAREHNHRDEALCSRESHIDLNNEHGDSFHEVVYRTATLYDAYASIFGNAIDDYNSKQKRKDRMLTVDSYIQSVEDDTRGNPKTKRINGKRVADKDAHQGKRTSYEITAKVGNTTSENGMRNEKLPRELQLAIMRKYCETFQDNNPNFRVINMDIHGDEGFYNRDGEWVYGGIHPHIEFIPVATGFKQGLSVQNSMNKAMKEMGFEGSDCYHQWATKEQKRLEEITQQEYRRYCLQHMDFAVKNGFKLEIYHPVAERTRQGGLSKEAYVREQKNQEDFEEILSMRNSLEIEKQECVNLYEALQNEKSQVYVKANALKAQEQILRQRVQEDVQKQFEERENTLKAQEQFLRQKVKEDMQLEFEVREKAVTERERASELIRQQQAKKQQELEEREKKVTHLERVETADSIVQRVARNNGRMPRGYEHLGK